MNCIYVDTSVVGGCHDDEFAPWSNGLMKDFRLGTFKPVVSRIVTLEIADAPEDVRRTYAVLLNLDYELLEVTPEATALADLYQQRGILTPKFYDDGLHIALATIAEVDVLASGDYAPGHHEAMWNATDVASGLYVYRLEANGVTITKKLVVQK